MSQAGERRLVTIARAVIRKCLFSELQHFLPSRVIMQRFEIEIIQGPRLHVTVGALEQGFKHIEGLTRIRH